MRIVIEVIPHAEQRYDTLGDWIPAGDDLLIFVSDTGDDRKNMLIALHELIEAELCTQRGISEATVAAFDQAHPELDDPGSDEQAPYRKEHLFAERIERLVCEEMGIEWTDYEAACRAASERG